MKQTKLPLDRLIYEMCIDNVCVFIDSGMLSRSTQYNLKRILNGAFCNNMCM